MPVHSVGSLDPRSRLVRDKYFTLRPRPLERWLWAKRVPSSAERVFWLHWQEGMQRGDWCSEIPLRRVARDCHLDVSTVTRAYQLLAKLGCLRRTDPGRDPGNPFQQATALTEVRLPRELLTEIERHPTRNRATHARQPEPAEEGRAVTAQPQPTAADLFPGLTGRARLRAIEKLTDLMSPHERHTYQEALRLHRPDMAFDPNSKVPLESQTTIRQLLTSLANPHQTPVDPSSPAASRLTPNTPRKLTLFDLGHLRQKLQAASTPHEAPELLRQVVWSVEAGGLRRFDTKHAIHIAVKKVREGVWTRPHRMPPNWARSLSAPEPCGHA